MPRTLPVSSLLAISIFSSGIALGATVPYGAIVGVETIGLAPATYAGAVFAGSLLQVAASMLLGHLSDRAGDRRKLILFCALFGIASASANFFFRSKITFLASVLALQPVAGAMNGQIYAYMRLFFTESLGEKGEVRLSSMRALLSLAWMLAPPLAGWLAAERSVFDVYALPLAGYGVVALIFVGLEVTASGRLASQQPKRAADAGPGRAIALSGLVGMAGYVVIKMALELHALTLPLALVNDFHGTTRDVGINAGICAGLEVPFMMLWARLIGRLQRETLMAIAALIFAAYLVLLMMARGTMDVFALQVVSAIAISALVSIPIAYMQDLIRGRLGLSASLLDLSNVTARLLSASLFGVMANGTEYLPLFEASAAAVCLGAGLMFAAAEVGRRAAVRSAA
ncbi:MFS transporter [Oryzibacter oryziterrae]|uniref:MFS transporter n=1 Tax=Oryzibacter oryziterrae TaxID=2766474 RepID=UPI001EFF944D|nr:MFS transporter [Oryzibacter oryziterrae]